MVYPSHDSSFIPSSVPLHPHQNELIKVSLQNLRDLQSAELCQMDRSCNIPNRKYTSSNLDRYLPRLQTKNNSRWEGKRSQNINLSCSPEVPNIQLPGISMRRKNSGTDSVISNTNSTSSWPWEICESESESFISLEDCKLSNKSSHYGLKSGDSKVGSSFVPPHPPASPRPPRSGKGPCVNSFHKRRNFKRSQHFELTLQNIEEVKDVENDLVRQSGSTGEMEGKKKNLGISHSRSYSTPVDYRELRKKIEATRVVSMGEMSSEFTKNYLTQKDKESDDMLRERCINWLKSLNPSWS